MAKNIYGHPLSDNFGADYDSYHEHHLHGLPNEPVADDTTDQLPLFAQVGRGISGDSYKVEISSDSDNATYLVGSRFDAAIKEWVDEWESENINGGHLSYSYQFYDDIVTPAFTITFTYTRPGRIEWEWTTPLIPYIPDDTENVVTLDKLASVLSVPKSQLQWLIDNKAPDEGSADDTGIHNTDKDLLDWIDDNDEDLGNAINSETVARQDADANLNTAIENEATTRKSADDGLQTAIDDEATTRKSADDGLQTAIDDEATTRKSADDTLQKNIDAIKQCECDEEALKEEILKHFHDDLGFDLDAFLTDGKGITVKEYIDNIAGSTETFITNINNYIYGEKITAYLDGLDFSINASLTGWDGVEIPFNKSTGDSGRLRFSMAYDDNGNPQDGLVTVNNINGTTALQVMVSAQIACQLLDDAYGISGGIHEWVTGSTSWWDVAQAQIRGTANSEAWTSLTILPRVVSIPAGEEHTFDISIRPLSPDTYTGRLVVSPDPTRTYMTIVSF